MAATPVRVVSSVTLGGVRSARPDTSTISWCPNVRVEEVCGAPPPGAAHTCTPSLDTGVRGHLEKLASGHLRTPGTPRTSLMGCRPVASWGRDFP